MKKEEHMIKNMSKHIRSKIANETLERSKRPIYGVKRPLRTTVTLLDACKIYSDYCDPRDIEFSIGQELEIMEGIMYNVDYSLYLNQELNTNTMRRVKDLLLMGVDVRRTLGVDIIQQEHSLSLLDISLRLRQGEDIIC